MAIKMLQYGFYAFLLFQHSNANKVTTQINKQTIAHTHTLGVIQSLFLYTQ